MRFYYGLGMGVREVVYCVVFECAGFYVWLLLVGESVGRDGGEFGDGDQGEELVLDYHLV